jgi:multiple sugar transport system substrate-binding protein
MAVGSRRKVSRRRFLTAAGAGVAGAALLRTAPWKAGAAPAQIKGTTLRILTWNHFVPDYDTYFDQFAADWGKENGVTVRVDHNPQLQLPARIASEAAAGAGHDIFLFQGQILLRLYYQHLVDLTDLIDKLGAQYGGWLLPARNLGVVDGRWYGFPDFYICIPMLYRKDLLAEAGLTKVPDTWDGWRAFARTMKPKGHQAGMAVSHCNDSNHNWRALFYDFGVKETDPSGKEILWDSKELREGMRYAKALWEETMTSEVFSWDDASDNRLLDSSVACWIHDAISAMRSIEKPNPTLYSKCEIGNEPLGPKGRFNVVDSNVFSIWKFSKNIAGAQAFLESYGSRVKEHSVASKGYNMPFVRDAYKKPMPILGDDPKFNVLQDWNIVARTFGFPGPVTAPAAEVLATYVVPDMVGRYFRGGDLEASIGWGMEQIKGIYAKYK